MLSSYIQNRNCVHCLMNKCSNKTCANKKCCEINVLPKYVNNPLLIDDLENNIKKVNIKINDYNNQDILKNGFMYTTCLFCLSKNNWNVCKNVKEGRFNTIILENGNEITYCYPELKNVKHRIQIGLHIDLKVDNHNNISYKFINNNINKNKVIENKVNNSYLNIVKNDEKEKLNKNHINNINNINNNNINNNINNINNINNNELYKELNNIYENIKLNYNNLLNKNNKSENNIIQIALKTKLNLLNIQMNEIGNILENFNQYNNYERIMDIIMDNEIKSKFNQIF